MQRLLSGRVHRMACRAKVFSRALPPLPISRLPIDHAWKSRVAQFPTINLWMSSSESETRSRWLATKNIHLYFGLRTWSTMSGDTHGMNLVLFSIPTALLLSGYFARKFYLAYRLKKYGIGRGGASTSCYFDSLHSHTRITTITRRSTRISNERSQSPHNTRNRCSHS